MAELELPPSQRSDHGGKIPLPQAAWRHAHWRMSLPDPLLEFVLEALL
jgi:hypothetical protein